MLHYEWYNLENFVAILNNIKCNNIIIYVINSGKENPLLFKNEKPPYFNIRL